MNIHEHQAKEILEEFGAPVTSGIAIFKPQEINEGNDVVCNNKLKFNSCGK